MRLQCAASSRALLVSVEGEQKSVAAVSGGECASSWSVRKERVWGNNATVRSGENTFSAECVAAMRLPHDFRGKTPLVLAPLSSVNSTSG